jgi:hypothetical protein
MMTSTTKLLRKLATALIVLAGLHGGAAWAVLACSISATPSPVTGIYSSAANLDIQGTFAINCTRDPNVDTTRRPALWIGVSQTASGSTMTRDIGGSTLPYTIYRRAFGNSVWLDTGSLNSTTNGNAGLLTEVDFGPPGAHNPTATANIPFYWRVASGLTRAAGVYLESGLAVTLRNTNAAGSVLSTTTVSSRANIQHDCHFLTPPASTASVDFNLAYTAFQSTAATASSSYYVTCTQGTGYSLALDLTRSVIPNVNLAYSLTLTGSTSGTGTGVQQTGFGITVSIDAGQAGACPLPPCTGTDIRTITITY